MAVLADVLLMVVASNSNYAKNSVVVFYKCCSVIRIFTIIVFCGEAPDTILNVFLTFSGWNSLLLAETDGILIVFFPCFFPSATDAIFIIFLSVSGGISPFWAGNRYRTMAKTLRQQLILFIAIYTKI